MKQQPLVSILINNYNKQNYCKQALKSAINQNYKNIEIIFYDDNSSDNSLKNIIELANKSKDKIKIIKNGTRGKIYSFNQMNGIIKSVDKSKGQIICLMDSDDFFKKNKVKKVVDFFSKNPKQEILFDRPSIYINDNDMKISTDNYYIRENKWPRFPSTSCISIKKNSLKKSLNKIKVKKYNDLWFDFRISTYFAINKNQFNCLKSSFTFYRQYEGNYDKNFNKYVNLKWWRRREQAFNFISYLNKKKYKKNIFSLDYLLTKLINKLFFIL